MPSCIVCQKDASSVCSLCKGAEGVMYCSQACQAKDWSIHKTKCPGRKKKQKPNSPPKPPPFVISEEDKQDAKFLPLVYYHPSQSPYGYSINPDTAIPSVFSSAAKHWISFSESSPRPVYERIADAFKYHITYTAPKFQSSNKDLGET
ncbi:hypothetical protein FRC02_012246 [Tulasnella sp. 418]|nr:hypothetical protein FRC02_012246 [Tulasnella sp. 418]